MDGNKVKFVRFARKDRLYALDSNGNVWGQIGPIEWENVTKDAEPERIEKGLSVGDLIKITELRNISVV
jgi:hypothetical protein